MNDVTKHNFFLSLTQTVIPRKCIRIADKETDLPWNTKTKTVKAYPNNEDMTFEFKIVRIDGCVDEFANTL